MLKTTLQNRLITIMVVFSLFFIVAFTAIQVANQSNSITLLNIYRSKIGAFVAKTAFETTFSKAAPSAADSASFTRALELTISTLKESEIIEKVSVMSKDGDMIVSSEALDQDLPPLRDRNQLEKLIAEKDSDKWLISYVDKKRRELNIFMRIAKDGSYILKLTYLLSNIQDALNQVYVPIILTFITVCAANFAIGMILSKAILSPLKLLNRTTKEVAAGNLDLKVRIKTEDELQELGETFNQMTTALKRMKERAENANPLTKLPGNIVIMENVEKRIKNNDKFAILYCDLNNFKAFNDKYGIYRGDEVIKMTANVLKEAVSAHGSQNDILGHEGGDDFIIITTPDKADAIAQYIIKTFDSGIRALYDKNDAENGSFTSLDRDGKLRNFPIMTIALSGVTNQHRRLTSYAEATNICAEVKKKVKMLAKSAWLMDKREAGSKIFDKSRNI